MTNGLLCKEDDVGKTQKVQELILSDPWCDVVKTIFDFHEIGSKKTQGQGICLVEAIAIQRVRMRKGKVQEWFKMKRQLQKQFRPFNYMQTIFQNLHRKPQETKYQQVQVLGSNLG